MKLAYTFDSSQIGSPPCPKPNFITFFLIFVAYLNLIKMLLKICPLIMCSRT